MNEGSARLQPSEAFVTKTRKHESETGLRFVREWLSDPVTEPIRLGFVDALSHGGAFTTTRGATNGRREFCAPYYYAAFPSEYWVEVPMVVIDKDVEVRTQPDRNSPLLGTVSWVIVSDYAAAQRDPADPRVLWQPFLIPPDDTGYVPASAIRPAEGFTMCFANELGQWVISYLSLMARLP